MKIEIITGPNLPQTMGPYSQATRAGQFGSFDPTVNSFGPEPLDFAGHESWLRIRDLMVMNPKVKGRSAHERFWMQVQDECASRGD